MAENVVRKVRYVSLVLLILSNMLGEGHAHWFRNQFPIPTPPSSTTTSPTTSTFTTPATPPSPSGQTAPSFSTPTTPPTTQFGQAPNTFLNPGSPPPPAVSTTPSFTTPTSPPPPSVSTSPTTGTTYTVVSQSGFGDYTTVQDAIDAVPTENTSPVTICIFSGTYTEKVSIPASKPYITLQGSGRESTIITYNDNANSTGSTAKSATVQVDASNFTARNITFQNSAPQATPGETGAQAVALRIAGDQAAFYGCGFTSSQDTLCDEKGRHYFKDCYIEGNIDIIWGNGQSLYDGCEIQSIAGDRGGTLTAQGRASADETSGFAFVGGSITGTGSNVLGRPYGTYSRVVFIDTYMEDIINPAGWTNWPTATKSRRLLDTPNLNVYYGEYNNTGPGANLTGRVSWNKQLTEADAEIFTSIGFINGSTWLASLT